MNKDNNIPIPNKLINEQSPYLLQHAYNPVNWFPWGEEAFHKAKAEDRPVFLSIGYSTCHWCHVMAHESFEDEEIARILNRHFVAIKVDREERPDIDTVYMTTCQALTGQGGWPLTIVMTPDKKPFFAGTYFPKQRRYNMPGLSEILLNLESSWNKDKEKVLEAAEKITKHIQEMKKEEYTAQEETVAEERRQQFHAAKETFAALFDKVNGGFGTSPKFPSPHNLMFLMRYSKYEEDKEAWNMVKKTLQCMAMGGIFDHVGYGFSRYSTDSKWLVPHFEKMLYDNALLAISYIEAYQLMGEKSFLTIAEKILTYVSREMTDPQGGFYCAQDADSEGEEGKYYVFSEEEAIKVLGKEAGERWNSEFDITEHANFEEGNIPNLIKNAHYEETQEIAGSIKKMYEYRKDRMELHKDDKLLTAWNSLMIVAFAKVYGATEKKEYLDRAVKAADFLANHMTDQGNGKLFVSYRQGVAGGVGMLDDYAFYIWALISLYEVTAKREYLDKALNYGCLMEDLFWDEKDGGFFLTEKEGESLLYRPKEIYDGAMPSGNSVGGYVLVKLKKMTAQERISRLCDRQLEFLQRNGRGTDMGHSFALMAMMMDFYERGFLCENGVCN